MGFLDEIKAHNARVQNELLPAHFDGLVEESFRSIVYGSEITGAPGQPVSQENVEEAGKLRDSWTEARLDANTALISTDVAYAPDVEDNLKGQHFHTGGPHGLKLTVAGAQPMADAVARKLAGT